MKTGIWRTQSRNGRRRIAAIVAAVAVALTACTTLPEPDGADDTAFALPIIPVWDSDGGSTFGYYEFTIQNISDPGIRRTINAYAGSGLEVLTGLPVGSYRISQYRFVYKESGRPGSSGRLGHTFTLEPGTITISPVTIYIRMYKPDPNADDNWMQLRWNDTTQPVRDDVIAELEQEEHFSSWRLAN